MVPSPQSTSEWLEVMKNIVLIVVGVFIIIHETLGADYPSPLLLLCAGACLGLPILGVIQDARRNGKSDG